MDQQHPQYITPPPSRQGDRSSRPDHRPPQHELRTSSQSTLAFEPDQRPWSSPYVFQSPASYSPWTMVPCDNTDLTESPPIIFDRSPYAWVPLPDVEEWDSEPLMGPPSLPTPPPSPTSDTGSRTKRRRGTSAKPTGPLQDMSHHVRPASTPMVKEAVWAVHSVASAIAFGGIDGGWEVNRRT